MPAPAARRAGGSPQSWRGPDLAGLWKYRVGDHRIIARIQDRDVVIAVVRVGNPREVYRR
ncbi:type II toxin-antitoxin system RelE/ParE family toxin [Rhizobium sp. CSW-27]|uniref:type II toxin-antitoxin system RelE family toxin n=1 Tax=Rhizobium sp. CSW-27 TaxID=2839985 RepID=UPI002078FFF3|nr:type II toxin-antitoxin system RelE/ParE family toxin [Rhizobium sp. CSW-27]